MPKAKIMTRLRSNSRYSQVQHFGSEIFTESAAKMYYCKLCHKNVNFNRKFYVKQLNSSSHQELVGSSSIESPQSATSETYAINLCKAFVGARIPFWKKNSPRLKTFVNKYRDRSTPGE